jgi:hypothetical protein
MTHVMTIALHMSYTGSSVRIYYLWTRETSHAKVVVHALQSCRLFASVKSAGRARCGAATSRGTPATTMPPAETTGGVVPLDYRGDHTPPLAFVKRTSSPAVGGATLLHSPMDVAENRYRAVVPDWMTAVRVLSITSPLPTSEGNQLQGFVGFPLSSLLRPESDPGRTPKASRKP